MYKHTEVVILISDKIDFKTKNIAEIIRDILCSKINSLGRYDNQNSKNKNWQNKWEK